MLNADPLNSRALGAALPPAGGIDCIPIIKRLPGSVLNSSPLGSWALNSSGGTLVIGCDDGPQGALFDPLERVEVYLLLVGDIRVPMSSFQATMRRTGQSFLQAIVPAGDTILPALEHNTLMQVQLGYYYPSVGEFDELETIAQAPLEQIRSDQGPTRFTLTLSGYGALPEYQPASRPLSGVQTRSINQGDRRVRCNVDLLLRPGHFATDTNGDLIRIEQIQYFVNATAAAMEVTGRADPTSTEPDPVLPITISFSTDSWGRYLTGDWVVAPDGTQISSAQITDDQESALILSLPYEANITVTYKVSSENNWDVFDIQVNGSSVFSDSGDKSENWLTASLQAGPSDNVILRYIKDRSVSELDDKAYIQKIELVPVSGEANG